VFLGSLLSILFVQTACSNPPSPYAVILQVTPLVASPLIIIWVNIPTMRW
jgi:hypothetical protein